MQWSQRVVFALVLSLGSFMTSLSAPRANAAEGKTNTLQVLMRQKLESVHGVLDALALEDYAKIEHYAVLLSEVGKATTWQKASDPDFMRHAKNFQASATFLAEQAHKKNLEGVSMGYIRVVMDCLSCHNSVRAGRTPN